MVSLIVLLGVAGLLLLVGVGEHLVSQGLAMARLAWARGVVCLAGMVAVVAVGAGETGFGFAADGLSRVVIAALFLVVATGGAGLAGVAGALAIAMLAADGAVLVVAVAVAVVLSAGMRGTWMGWGAVGCLAVAVLVAGWHDGAFDPRFVAIRGGEAQGPAVMAAMMVATVAAAAMSGWALPGGLGGLHGFYLVGRMLLDVAGRGTPGWWGVPVLLLGVAAAVWGARRVGTARDGAAVAVAAGVAGQGFAVVGLGVSLLARGADLPGLEALGAAGALLELTCWALWGGLLTLCLRVMRDAVGSDELVRMGGVLRRAPGMGVAMLVAVVSMGAWPGSAGFAGVWLVLQAVLGAGRLGGTVWLALAASALAGLGLAAAWLAAGAVRVGGMVLLEAPRAGKAWVQPGRSVLAGVAGLAFVVVGMGTWPGALLWLIQPGVRVLSGGEARGSVWSVAGVAGVPGGVGPVLAVLLAVAVAGVAWAGRAPVVAGAPVLADVPWRGGMAADGVSRENGWQVGSGLRPGWRGWRPVISPWMGVVALGLVLAVVLGWAAR